MRWSYKTVHFSLKKDGILGSAFLDEEEIEITLNEFGHVGWELVSFMEISDGVIAVFKMPISQNSAVAASDNKETTEEDSPAQGGRVVLTEELTTATTTAAAVSATTLEQAEKDEEGGSSEAADAGSIKIF